MDFELDFELKQMEIIDPLVVRASTCYGNALGDIITEATSHPSIFAFSEILALPNVAQLEGTQNSVYLDVLRLFAYGTWGDYKSNASGIQLNPEQILKLKQLTMLTLAKSNKVLPYDTLKVELDVTSDCELEHYLINECMYKGIVRGQLDQLKRCFENGNLTDSCPVSDLKTRIATALESAHVEGSFVLHVVVAKPKHVGINKHNYYVDSRDLNLMYHCLRSDEDKVPNSRSVDLRAATFKIFLGTMLKEMKSCVGEGKSFEWKKLGFARADGVAKHLQVKHEF